jgi:hypothetical protein
LSTFTEFSCFLHGTTTTICVEGLGYTIRVAVTLLAKGIVEPLWGALVTLFPNKISFTVANPVIGARHPIRTHTVTATSEAGRVVVIPRGALVAFPPTKVDFARALSTVRLTNTILRCRTIARTFTWLAVWISIPALLAFITPLTPVSFLAQTFALIFVTNFFNRAFSIAVTGDAVWVVVISMVTFFTSPLSILGFATTLTIFWVTDSALRIRGITVTRCALRKVIKTLGALIAKSSSEIVFARTLQILATCTDRNPILVGYCSLREASTRFAVWVVIIPLGTDRAVRSSHELWLAMADSAVGGTAACVARILVTVAGDAGIGVIREHTRAAVEPVDTAFAVDAVCVMLALLTHPTTLVVTMDIQRQELVIHSLVEMAFV